MSKGEKVQTAEVVLSQYSLRTATTPGDAAYNVYQEHKYTFRNFYCGPAHNRSKRQYQMRQDEAYDRTYLAERSYCQQEQQVLHIMFLGDSGYGSDSFVRVHVRIQSFPDSGNEI